MEPKQRAVHSTLFMCLHSPKISIKSERTIPPPLLYYRLYIGTLIYKGNIHKHSLYQQHRIININFEYIQHTSYLCFIGIPIPKPKYIRWNVIKCLYVYGETQFPHNIQQENLLCFVCFPDNQSESLIYTWKKEKLNTFAYIFLKAFFTEENSIIAVHESLAHAFILLWCVVGFIHISFELGEIVFHYA